jgi:DNA mismatch endonuclease (patch repair protein)
VFAGAKLAVYVDGCQWHGCPDHYVRPRTGEAFWSAKLAENVDRDRRQTQTLESLGWTVIRIWEHELRRAPERAARLVLDALAGRPPANRRAWRVREVVILNASTDLERRVMVALRGPLRQRVVDKTRSTSKA